MSAARQDYWKKVINYRYSHLHDHAMPGNKMFGPNLYNQESGKKQFVIQSSDEPSWKVRGTSSQSRSPSLDRSVEFNRDALMKKMGHGPSRKPPPTAGTSPRQHVSLMTNELLQSQQYRRQQQPLTEKKSDHVQLAKAFQMDSRYAKPMKSVQKNIDYYARSLCNQTAGLDGPERRRSQMHDNCDVSYDLAPAKRKLPLNTIKCYRGKFNVTQVESDLDNAFVRGKIFFPVNNNQRQQGEQLQSCQRRYKEDPKKNKTQFEQRNRKQIDQVKTNNTQHMSKTIDAFNRVSDTFGSSFNVSKTDALEKLAKMRYPNANGWQCKTVNRASPSRSQVDEFHFRTDLRKASGILNRRTLQEIDAHATGMGTWQFMHGKPQIDNLANANQAYGPKFNSPNIRKRN